MRPSLPRLLMLVLALLLGQWLMFAHDSQHPLQKADDPACELCIHLHQLGAAVPLVSAVALPLAAHEMANGPLLLPVRAASVRHYPIRGPPTLHA